MNAPLILDSAEIVYPESDGLPMAENTLQFRHIVTIKENLDHLFSAQVDVFVAGDLFWYPMEGCPGIRQAPDVMVAFGRPKGDRRSYLQWKEGGIAPQVVFEIWSPSNRPVEIVRKLSFYDRHGVEEYYWYDPDNGDWCGYLRKGGSLEVIPDLQDWVSPRLGVRFTLEGTELVLYRPDGQRFLTFHEIASEREKALARVEQESQRAAQEAQRAAQEAQRAALAEAEVARLRALLAAKTDAPGP